MLSFVEVVASGIFSVFNRIVVNGLLGKAIFGVIFGWVITQLLGGLATWVASYLTLNGPGAMLGGFGQAGAVALWFFQMAFAPGIGVFLGLLAIRFIIRRIPLIG